MELAERGRELDVLDGLFSAALRGSGQIALITGGVAGGKTQLLNTFADRVAEQDAIVLTATASLAERELRFGVLEQLLGQVSLPPEVAGKALALLEERRAAETGAGGPPATRVIHELCGALLALARRRPVLLGVDDVQFADDCSLETLQYLQRRMRSARLLMVLTEWQQPRPRRLPFHTEVARLPYFSRLRLSPLSRTGVAEVLAQHLDTPAARQLAPACHQLSGGNPLLVHALIEDFLAARHSIATSHGTTAGARAELEVGDAFGHAVLSCLHRWEPRLLEVAQGLVVLGAGAPPHLLGRLLGITADSAAQVLDVLTMAGLLDRGGFRHRVAEEMVHSSMAAELPAKLHRRAADLRHGDGDPAAAVARHLIAADTATEPWAVEVLRKAAEQALAEDRPALAVSSLELARRDCADEQQRAAATALLALAEWRTRPATANLHISRLRAAARSGHLTGQDALPLVKYLLWHGKPAEAAELLRLLIGENGQDAAIPQLRLTYALLSYSHPAAFPKLSAVLPGADEQPLSGDPWLRAASSLAAALTHGPVESAIGSAEHVLQTCALTDESLDTLLCALLALLYADRADRAAPLCDMLLEEANRRGATVWQAQLSGLRADLALRQGDPLLATELAQSALRLMPAASWGDGVGAPLSVLLLAAIAVGDFTAGAALLKRPVPPSMFQTWFGPQYLYARGQYFLAVGRIKPALSDFHQCGALMRHWGIDHPAVAPWRTGMALAQLRQNRHGLAAQLAAEQLELPGAGLRTRGISLRLLAVAGAEDQRLSRLRGAAELLRDCGDHLELAAALAELSTAHRGRGDSARSREYSAQAIELARTCQADTLHQELLAGRDAAGEPEPDGLSTLSKAEWRVASLAGLGHTNRVIGRKLGITISTVEQHLTRVYRKLKVNNRAELPVGLPLQPRREPVGRRYRAGVTPLHPAGAASG